MEWRDEGIVLSSRAHGETSAVVELFTRDHGRHLGLVKGGRGRAQRPLLQPGNTLMASWWARLDEHLGSYRLDGHILRAARLMETRGGTYGLTHLASLARLLPERDPHPNLFDAMTVVLDHLDHLLQAAALMARFELQLLVELGFGLDLSCCAATGGREDLVYVSPKTGRAVSRAAGEPWKERLLPLPAFLLEESDWPDAASILEGARLTGFFLNRDIFEPRGMEPPPARAAFFEEVGKAL